MWVVKYLSSALLVKAIKILSLAGLKDQGGQVTLGLHHSLPRCQSQGTSRLLRAFKQLSCLISSFFWRAARLLIIFKIVKLLGRFDQPPNQPLLLP